MDVRAHTRHSGAGPAPKATGLNPESQRWSLRRAKHSGIPGSHYSGSAAFVRPGMTSGARGAFILRVLIEALSLRPATSNYRSTRCARETAGSNQSAKYCVSLATRPSWNSMMLTA